VCIEGITSNAQDGCPKSNLGPLTLLESSAKGKTSRIPVIRVIAAITIFVFWSWRGRISMHSIALLCDASPVDMHGPAALCGARTTFLERCRIVIGRSVGWTRCSFTLKSRPLPTTDLLHPGKESVSSIRM
jgi:hypothetical protein